MNEQEAREIVNMRLNDYGQHNIRVCPSPLIPSIQGWLNNPDISQARTLKHWLEEELNISVTQVLDIEVQADMIEQEPDKQYRQFKQGKFTHFVLTLLNGDKLHRSFRRGE